MKKVLFLSSALVMGMVSFGAYAADEIITGGAGTCTADVLGVSADGATANTIAVWSINEYTLAPGEYLSVTETSVDKTPCPVGSYCVGGTNFTVDNAATSIEQCPTEYPNSAAGAGAQTQCYTACTVATANIAHATAVGGNDYFGDGADACYATDCDTGYHIDGDVELIEQTPVIPVNYETASDAYASIGANGSLGFENFSGNDLTERGTWVSISDYFAVYGKASCQPNFNPAYGYFSTNAAAVLNGTMSIEDYEAGILPLVGQAKTDYAVKLLTDFKNGSISEEEVMLGSLIVFGSEFDANYQTTDTGQYCYCQLDSFILATDGIPGEKTSVTSAPWVALFGLESADSCASYCALGCGQFMERDDEYERAFRAAMFGAFGYTETATCAANTINIDWNPDNGGEHTQNMCTYDGSITLPIPDPVKPGYTFTGWKLVE